MLKSRGRHALHFSREDGTTVTRPTRRGPTSKLSKRAPFRSIAVRLQEYSARRAGASGRRSGRTCFLCLPSSSSLPAGRSTAALGLRHAKARRHSRDWFANRACGRHGEHQVRSSPCFISTNCFVQKGAPPPLVWLLA